VRTLEVGDVLFIPAGVIHSATNTGAGNGAELASYIVEKGKPLVTVVKCGGSASLGGDAHWILG